MAMKTPLRVCFRVIAAAALSSLLGLTASRAHEVQPTVVDLTIGAEKVELIVQWMVETAVAELDLTSIENTTEAENDDRYNLLRALGPEDLSEEIRAAWPGIAAQVELMAGEQRLPLELVAVEVPEVGNTDIARVSTLTLAAQLPPGDTPLTFRAEAALGPFVVRQQGVENGYADYLAPGVATAPIERGGADDQTALEAFTGYIAVGFDHIVPKGLDHILFVLGLFFLSTRMGPLLWQVSAFTLAHTVTLALGALDILRIPPSVVEPLIAASIVYVGVENTFMRNLSPWRPFVVFGFGLLHGLGFAAVLQDFGLGSSHFLPKLLGFNLGVELGQLAVIATAWLTLNLFFDRFGWYHRRIATPVSVAIALIAAFWVLERTGVIDASGPWSLFTALTEGGFDPIWIAIGALALAALITFLEMLTITEDLFREFAGVVTSLLMFLAIVATFTSGAWVIAAILAGGWVLALRLQSLGEPAEA
jgi:hypothetical protein